MNCPKCNNKKHVKAGFVNDKQRFKCKSCGCCFTVEVKSTAKSNLLKKHALHLYIEGLNYREISKLLGVSYVSEMRWIRVYRDNIKKVHKETAKAKKKSLIETKEYINIRNRNKSPGLLIIDLGEDEKNSYICETWWTR